MADNMTSVSYLGATSVIPAKTGIHDFQTNDLRGFWPRVAAHDSDRGFAIVTAWH